MGSFFIRRLLFSMLVLGVLQSSTVFNVDCWAQIGLNRRATTPLADLSGMVWVGGNRFIAVHDAKVEDEFFKPRVAALRLPRDSRGLTYKDSRVSYRRETPNDLESVAAIPGTNQVLLVESGDGKHDPSVQRIFKADVKQNGVRIRSVTQWPFPITNVEGTAVAHLGETHVFLYAERADNLPSTELSWVVFDPKKMEFASTADSVTFESPDPARFNRVIVGLDVDSDGLIYSVSAFDAEAAGLPDPDNGPFAAGVYLIGQLKWVAGKPQVELHDPPICLAMVDGFKVESVAVRQDPANDIYQLYIGTDDENYGGTLRPLPPPVIDP